MKITIEMENLNKIVEEAIKQNTEATIQDYVAQKTAAILEASYKKAIEEQVETAIKQSINTYLDTFEIKIGNPFDGQAEQTFTPTAYINHKIAELFEKEIFTEQVKQPWSNSTTSRTISFVDYINKRFDIDNAIKTHMDKFAKSLRDEVRVHLEQAYNKATRDALSDVVVDTIMENEKFKSINNNIKRLGG